MDVNQSSHVMIPLTKGLLAIVDAVDADDMLRFRWISRQYRKTFYAARSVSLAGGGRVMITMHRQILGFPAGLEVDHINMNGLDNRRANLRAASRAENSRNSGKPARLLPTSSYKGVMFDRARSRWRASITLNGKNMFLGNFDREDEAAKHYDMASRSLFGRFARTNFYGE